MSCRYRSAFFKIALTPSPESNRICLNCQVFLQISIVIIKIYMNDLNFSFYKADISYNEIIPDTFGPNNMHTLK